MIVNYWPNWFRALYGGHWPTSYCAVDTETTGYSPNQDVVTEWGHCLVEDNKVIDQLSLVINWTGRMEPPEHWLSNRIRKVREHMTLSGKAYHMSIDKMKTEGMSPEKAFEFISRFTERLKARGVPFVLHNHNFDEKMLSANFMAYKAGRGFSFGDRIIDTDAIEKASQIPDNPRVHPKQSDSLRDYSLRVKYTRVNGCKSNMDEHCYVKYRFKEKYGINLEDMHAAKMDSYCCHLLMQEFGKLITEPQLPPVFPSEDHKAATKAQKPKTVSVPGQRRVRGQRRS